MKGPLKRKSGVVLGGARWETAGVEWDRESWFSRTLGQQEERAPERGKKASKLFGAVTIVADSG